VAGECKRPCEFNEECPFFWQCVAGQCVETGCTSDRECVLAAGSANPGGFEDGCLQRCLASDEDPTINTCKIPCENDGACSQFQVCAEGYCKFVGCQEHEECRAYLGVEREMPSDARPFVTQAVCRE
jgi:hypothetical protein